MKVWAASGAALRVGGGPTAEPQRDHGPGVGPTTHHRIYCVYKDAVILTIIFSCADEESEARGEPGSDFSCRSDVCLRGHAALRLRLTPGARAPASRVETCRPDTFLAEDCWWTPPSPGSHPDPPPATPGGCSGGEAPSHHAQAQLRPAAIARKAGPILPHSWALAGFGLHRLLLGGQRSPGHGVWGPPEATRQQQGKIPCFSSHGPHGGDFYWFCGLAM